MSEHYSGHPVIFFVRDGVVPYSTFTEDKYGRLGLVIDNAENYSVELVDQDEADISLLISVDAPIKHLMVLELDDDLVRETS